MFGAQCDDGSNDPGRRLEKTIAAKNIKAVTLVML
jgi:hypothetical protein